MENKYSNAVNLSEDLVEDVKIFESKLREETHKDVVVVVYEKDEPRI